MLSVLAHVFIDGARRYVGGYADVCLVIWTGCLRAPELRQLRGVRDEDVDRFVFDRADVLFHVIHAQRSVMVLMLGSTGGIVGPIGVRLRCCSDTCDV